MAEHYIGPICPFRGTMTTEMKVIPSFRFKLKDLFTYVFYEGQGLDARGVRF